MAKPRKLLWIGWYFLFFILFTSSSSIILDFWWFFQYGLLIRLSFLEIIWVGPAVWMELWILDRILRWSLVVSKDVNEKASKIISEELEISKNRWILKILEVSFQSVWGNFLENIHEPIQLCRWICALGMDFPGQPKQRPEKLKMLITLLFLSL